MVGLDPSKIAMVFLKINIAMFVITLGASLFSLFPYYMHINSISNNIALDVANNNYIIEDDVENYVDHLSKSMGEPGAVTYSILTFKKADLNNATFAGGNDSGSLIRNGVSGIIAYSDPVNVESNDFYINKGGEAVVAVTVKPLEGPTNNSLIVGDSSFDPLNKNADIVRGMNADGSLGNNSTLVQRGTPFIVKVKTRFDLSGGLAGFMLHTSLPVEAETVGVSTKYYQYEN